MYHVPYGPANTHTDNHFINKLEPILGLKTNAGSIDHGDETITASGDVIKALDRII